MGRGGVEPCSARPAQSRGEAIDAPGGTSAPGWCAAPILLTGAITLWAENRIQLIGLRVLPARPQVCAEGPPYPCDLRVSPKAVPDAPGGWRPDVKFRGIALIFDLIPRYADCWTRQYREPVVTQRFRLRSQWITRLQAGSTAKGMGSEKAIAD